MSCAGPTPKSLFTVFFLLLLHRDERERWCYQSSSFPSLALEQNEQASVPKLLLYTNGQNDMTDDVLGQINANAPPGVLGADTKDDKPATAPPLSPPIRTPTRDRK